MVSIGDTKFGVQLGIGVLGRVVMMLVAFAGAVILARELGPDGYGAFYLLLAIVSFLDNPVTGWANACRKRFTEEDFPAEQAVGSVLIGVVVGAVAVALAAAALAPFVIEFTNQSNGPLLLVALFAGVATYLGTLELLKASANFGASNWMMAGRDILRVIAQLSLVLAGWGVTGMVVGMVAANLIVAPIALALLGVRPALPTRDTFDQVWMFARSSIPNGVVGTAQNRMDVLLLGALASTGVVGNYEAAIRITMPAMFVAGVASSGLMGRVSNLRSKGEAVGVDVQNNLSYASLVAVPLFFGALTVGTPVIVTVFSNQYADAGAFITGLALFHLFRSQKSILAATLDGFDRPELNLRVSTGVFLLNVVLGVGLFFSYGPIGIVVATIVSEAVGYGARARLVHRLIPSVKLLPQPLYDQLTAGVIMAVVVFALREVFSLGRWEAVGGIVAVGGAAYFAALVAISEPFRETVRAVARDAGL